MTKARKLGSGDTIRPYTVSNINTMCFIAFYDSDWNKGEDGTRGDGTIGMNRDETIDLVRDLMEFLKTDTIITSRIACASGAKPKPEGTKP